MREESWLGCCGLNAVSLGWEEGREGEIGGGKIGEKGGKGRLGRRGGGRGDWGMRKQETGEGRLGDKERGDWERRNWEMGRKEVREEWGEK